MALPDIRVYPIAGDIQCATAVWYCGGDRQGVDQVDAMKAPFDRIIGEFRSGETLTYSDLEERTGIELPLIVRICNELATIGMIEVENITLIKLRQGEGVMSKLDILEDIRYYEDLFGMSSKEFMKMVVNGNMPDTFEHQQWRSLIRYL